MRVSNPTAKPIEVEIVQSPYVLDGLRNDRRLTVAPGDNAFTVPMRDPPRPGSVSVRVWGYSRDEEGRSVMRPLDQGDSVETTMARAAGGEAQVQVAGGWDCAYSIQEHILRCSDPAGVREKWETVQGLTYSGNKSVSCINRPCAQCYRQELSPGVIVGGPIPAGKYLIGEGFLDPRRPMMSYVLSKVAGTMSCDKITPAGQERDAMMIHFGTGAGGVGPWSEGCIIVVSDNHRDRLNELGGGVLTVTPGVDVAGCAILTTDTEGKEVYNYSRGEFLGWEHTDGTANDRCAGIVFHPKTN